MAKQPNGRSRLIPGAQFKKFMKKPRAWIICALIFFAVLGLLRLLGDQLYDYPDNPEVSSLPKNATIVCLAGGKHRIETAFALFSEGIGDRLFIVGAGRKTTPLSLLRSHGPEAAARFPWKRFDHNSRNTMENAFAVRNILEQNPEIKTLILVTSEYHMRRAELMIRHHIAPEIKIIPFTPAVEAIERGNWWHSCVGAEVTLWEYFKFMRAKLLLPLMG
jgi:uncharacterized SAM-binding protein YcdF (DUF218 family)